MSENNRALVLNMLREFGRPANLNEVCVMFPRRSRKTILEMLLFMVDCGEVRIHHGFPPIFPRLFEALNRGRHII